MSRLLTGYASGYNRRHGRSGHLFQNRYRSILCQEETCLKELVRYIHLNPLRARVVKDIKALDQYPYSGHSVILGNHLQKWQSTDAVLAVFSSRASAARRKYHEYVAEGASQGRRPELTGGGLMRSAGGWAGVQELRKTGGFQKRDERILGDGDFGESVLAEADEQLDRRYSLRAKGMTLEKLQQSAADLIGIRREQIVGPSKARVVGRARNVLCYWAVRGLGFSMTQVSKHLQISVPTVSIAVHKGEALVHEQGWALEKLQM
jgi:hypothetical protein